MAKTISRRPKVGVIVDHTTSYGRSVLRDVMRYAGIEHRWIIFTQMENVMEGGARALPELDGMI